MKKLLVSAMALTFGVALYAQDTGARKAVQVDQISGSATGANTGESIQNGSDNAVQVRQAGTEQSTLTNQNGVANFARVMQTGNVNGNQALSGQLNLAEVQQTGYNNQATSVQEGDRNNSFISQNNDAGEESLGNRAQIMQGTGDNSEDNDAAIEQDGQDNSAYTLQTYDNSDASTVQNGVGNTSEINQNAGPENSAGHFAIVDQTGMNNESRVNQSGADGDQDRNSAFARQTGVGNKVEQIQVSSGSAGGNKIKISSLRAEFTTFNTGGDRITTPEDRDPNANTFPDQLGFDNMESYYIGVEASPMPGLRANVVTNILGNVARNPIDEIFFENRGRPVNVETDNGIVPITDNNRVQIYQAEFDWNTKYANVKGFYRTGHYHWGYEGDFFGLYPEANYGPNIDLYNGLAPFGFEFEGKKEFKGLKVAFGPELWWGANPAVLVKYEKQFGKYKVAGIFHEDIAQQGGAGVTSGAIPQPRTRRFTGYAQRKFGKFDVELGGIWAGQPLNGREYQIIQNDENGNTNVLVNTIDSDDNWGGKLKVKYTGGKFNWYAQAAAQGLVAGGGADYTKTFTGWRLKDSGSGNQYNFLTGFTYTIGNLQIAPNFLWQEPIVDPIPLGSPAPARARNILADPFVVRSNRRTTAGEILLTYDPTPGSWFYEWDNDRAEDAPFAANLGFVYRHLPTTQDAAIGFFGNSRVPVAFESAPSAQDLWEINGRIVSKLLWRQWSGKRK